MISLSVCIVVNSQFSLLNCGHRIILLRYLANWLLQCASTIRCYLFVYIPCSLVGEDGKI